MKGIFSKLLLLVVILPMTIASNFQWVVANLWESHAQACSRVRLSPTDKIIPFDWNTTSINLLVKTLKFSNWSISSCCAPGLWCSPESHSCFTQSYGLYFENYGWLSGNVSNRPVFSCGAPLPPSAQLVSVTKVLQHGDFNIDNDLSDPSLFIAGAHFGLEENRTTMSIAGQDCNNLEICNHVCDYCGPKYSCAGDSECLDV